MKSGEELMLLLELNGYEVKKYRLKKQLEFEKTGNSNLYKHKKLSNLLLDHYTYVENTDYYKRNPLTYNEFWANDAMSIDDFYVTHPDIEGTVTLKHFLDDDTYNDISRESILYDIFDNWVEEYREASITNMENLREMITLLPKKNNKYRKPSRIAFIISILLASITVLIYKNPEIVRVKLIPALNDNAMFINDLLHKSSLYSFLGVLSIMSLVIYAILSNLVKRLLVSTRLEKNKKVMKIFNKWDKDIQTLRLDQSGFLEDYVDQVMNNKDNSEFKIIHLGKPEILLLKLKEYVRKVEFRFDWSKKNYSKVSQVLRILFIGAIVFNILFYVIGFLMV